MLQIFQNLVPDLSVYLGYLIYLLTAIGLTPGGSSTVHTYTQTVHRTTQLTTLVGRFSGIRTQRGKGGLGVMLTTHPLLVPRLRKSWDIPPLTLCVLLGLLRGSLYPNLNLTSMSAWALFIRPWVWRWHSSETSVSSYIIISSQKEVYAFWTIADIRTWQFIFIWHSEDRASWYILIIKTNQMHYFSNLFYHIGRTYCFFWNILSFYITEF